MLLFFLLIVEYCVRLRYIVYEGGDGKWCLILVSVDFIIGDQVDINGVDFVVCLFFVC